MPARQRKTINVEIGTRIKEQRKTLGLTREQLAALTGYSVSFLQEIERGRSGLSSESMMRISSALGVSADFILNGSADQKALADSIARKINHLDARSLSYLAQIIDVFVDSHCTE